MTAIRGERVRLGQADGTEIELVVSGNEDYAHYETPSGYAVIEDSGMFVYARLVDGRFVSTGVPADREPPPGVAPHERESAAVRLEKSAARRAARDRRGGE